jgi:hypothetical protein
MCRHELESLDLADELIRVTTEWTRGHLDASAISLWIDDECTSTSNPRLLIEDIVRCCDLCIVISEHEVWESLHETLVLDPCSMREDCVCRGCEYCDSELIELGLGSCHILELCRTDKSEISRIEKKYRPLAMEIMSRDIGGIISGRIISWEVKSWSKSIDFDLFV